MITIRSPGGGGGWKDPETHTNRQATMHDDCLPSLLGDGDKLIEMVYGEEKNVLYLVAYRQPRQNKNLLYRHDKPNGPTKEVSLSFVLFESLCASVSTVSRGHPSLI
jgi:hypothetical protein